MNKFMKNKNNDFLENNILFEANSYQFGYLFLQNLQNFNRNSK